MALYLGIDGGGTRTTCLVGDEDSVLGLGESGASNVVRVGEAKAAEALTTAIHEACLGAQITPKQIVRTCAGIAGAARPQVSSMIRAILSEIVTGEIEIFGEHPIALAAAFGDQPGVWVNAGTGAIAYGRGPDGNTLRVGGWGFAISDEGSAHWIGREAISAALREVDEGKTSKLLEDILAIWELKDREALVMSANSSSRPDFASLLPVVVKLADGGDSAAQSVLYRAAGELAAICTVAVRRLFPNEGTVPVAMTGGVFRYSTCVRQAFYSKLTSECPSVKIRESLVDPAEGALALARAGNKRAAQSG